VEVDLDGLPRPLDGLGSGSPKPDLGAYEFLLATADSNGDGIPDGRTWEQGLNPIAPDLAIQDPDVDGASTGEEWVADTNHTEPSSVLRLGLVREENRVVVTFPSSARRRYTLESGPDPGATVWVPVPGQILVPGNDGMLSFAVTSAAIDGFYRIRVSL